jgi:hypothetical protein
MIKYPTINEFGETGFQSMSWEENEIKAFKRIAWEPGNFKDLTIIYQPGAHVADVELVFPLELPSPEVSNQTHSIIAIHALDGHPWTSYSADFDPTDPYSKEVNWLKDILPQALRQQGIAARIMAFGYDSERWLCGPPRDMDMPSNDLLSNLESERFARFVVSLPTLYKGAI